MTNNPKPKLTNVERRRLHYRKLYGLDKPESSGDLRTDIRRWSFEADEEKAQEKKKKLSKVTPQKIDVDGITKSRLQYEKIMGDFDHD